jgi:peroxisomal enoyl-CoA hydratase 2
MSSSPSVSESYTVDLPAIVRYAGASGDFTPIHYDAGVLASAGYDRFFAMGMLVAGRLGALVVSTFGEHAVRSFSVRFRKRSWVGNDVTVALEPTDEATVFELVATSDGEVIATGRAVVEVQPESEWSRERPGRGRP